MPSTTTTSTQPLNYAGPSTGWNVGGRNTGTQLSPTDIAFQNYGKSANQSNSDYSDIMQKYRDLYGGANNGTNGLNLNYNYTVPTYQTSQDYRGAVNNLSSLSSSGGYSPQDVADIRARAIAPIRSTYGNAQQNLERSRSLAGGYSPNFTAATTKMAREMSNQLSDATTSANAGIAQNIAQNKIATASPLASITEAEQGAHNQFNLEAANMGNQIGLRNLDAQIQQYQLPIQTKLSALNGMQSMYGTTPAVPNMMGNNALSLAQLQAAIKSQNQNNGLRRVSTMMGVQ